MRFFKFYPDTVAKVTDPLSLVVIRRKICFHAVHDIVLCTMEVQIGGNNRFKRFYPPIRAFHLNLTKIDLCKSAVSLLFANLLNLGFLFKF